jgi:5'-3' exonuclease
MLYRTFFVQKQESDETIAGLATHTGLVTLNKYFKKFKPDRVVMAFDRASWRKEYTASELCLSKKPYKGNRRKDMTPAQEAKYARFKAHISEFENLIAEHTTIISLAEERCEADDLIAGFCQHMKGNDDDEIIIISADSDLLQLTRYGNVKVISPANDKEQSLADYNDDPLYYLFQKCVRGDPTDNVQSAYPRVQSKRIEKAYNDPFERVQLMKERWTNENKVEFLVEKIFEENQLLIDLEKQPADIRALIENNVKEALEKERQFSMFFILKFIGKYKLNRIKESIDQYIPLLSR